MQPYHVIQSGIASFLQDVIEDNEQTSQHSEASASSCTVSAPSIMGSEDEDDSVERRMIATKVGRRRTAKEGIIGSEQPQVVSVTAGLEWGEGG